MMYRRGVCVAWLALLAGCYSNQGTDGDESPYPELEAVALPDEVQTQKAAIVMRFTNGSTLDNHIYTALNRLANEHLDLGDMLMRGGLPKDLAGNDIAPAVADFAGTSPEQVAYAVANGLLTTDEAVDACGNKMVGAFITPDMVQHVGLGTDAANFPESCAGADCDTLSWGTIEIVPSAVRFDGMMDLIVNVHPNLTTGEPALFGHLLGWMLTGNHPGFTEVPLVFSVDKAQVLMFNLWEEQKTYEHEGVGSRQVMAMPHTERSIDRAADMLVTIGPRGEDECRAKWDAEVGGTQPFGCAEGLPLLVDRSAPAGSELYSTYLKEGADPQAIETVRQILEYQLQASIACPGAGMDRNIWLKEDSVELFLCPDTDLDTCLATEDMEEYACRPVEETRDIQYPENQQTPIVLGEKREPTVLRSWNGFVDELLLQGLYPGAGDAVVPFVGTEVELELTVDDDTVMYLREPLRVTEVAGAGGTQGLPEPVLNSHCEEDPAFRYDLGAEWGPGTYTLTVPWTDLDEDLEIHLTSVPTWVF